MGYARPMAARRAVAPDRHPCHSGAQRRGPVGDRWAPSVAFAPQAPRLSFLRSRRMRAVWAAQAARQGSQVGSPFLRWRW